MPMFYKMNFWQFFLLHIPPVVLLYSCSFSGRQLHAWRENGPCVSLITSATLRSQWAGCLAVLHVWFRHWVDKLSANDTSPTPGMSHVRRRSHNHRYERGGGVAAAASHRPHQVVWPSDVAVHPAAAAALHFTENCKNSAFETFQISRRKHVL